MLSTREIFADAQLKMTKWKTSDDRESHIGSKKSFVPVDGLLARNMEEGNPKVLGVSWETETDCFLFNPTEIMEAARAIGDKPTKRNILQILSRIFDPLGFLAPVVLTLKMLFQQSWEKNIGWDDPVPMDIKNTWMKTMAGLNCLTEVRVPRWLGTGPQETPLDLHVFGDASTKGYGAVSYLRLDMGDRYKTELLCSETVVAPLPNETKSGVKEVTLARLELLSALTATRIGEAVKNALHEREFTTTYVSGSKVALGWIRGDSSRL